MNTAWIGSAMCLILLPGCDQPSSTTDTEFAVSEAKELAGDSGTLSMADSSEQSRLIYSALVRQQVKLSQLLKEIAASSQSHEDRVFFAEGLAIFLRHSEIEEVSVLGEMRATVLEVEDSSASVKSGALAELASAFYEAHEYELADSTLVEAGIALGRTYAVEYESFEQGPNYSVGRLPDSYDAVVHHVFRAWLQIRCRRYSAASMREFGNWLHENGMRETDLQYILKALNRSPIFLDDLPPFNHWGREP